MSACLWALCEGHRLQAGTERDKQSPAIPFFTGAFAMGHGVCVYIEWGLSEEPVSPWTGGGDLEEEEPPIPHGLQVLRY